MYTVSQLYNSSASTVQTSLRFSYIRAKANFFLDLCRCCCHCNINTQIGNNVTRWKRRCFRFCFRSSINEPLQNSYEKKSTRPEYRYSGMNQFSLHFIFISLLNVFSSLCVVDMDCSFLGNCLPRRGSGITCWCRIFSSHSHIQNTKASFSGIRKNSTGWAY